MKRSIKFILAICLVISCTLGLSSCDKSQTFDRDVLRIYNCQDYIDEGLDSETGEKINDSVMESWKKDFEERHPGRTVTVIYDTFETPEYMLNQIKTGKQFDLICPSDYTIQKMIKDDMLEKFDEGALEGENNYLQNASPYLIKLFEENNWTDYAACYMWGTLGLIYNQEIVSEEDVKYWSAMWDEKYKGIATAKDSVRDTYFMGVMYVHQEELLKYRDDYQNGLISQEEYNQKINEIANLTDDETIETVRKELRKLKNNIFGLEVDSGKSDIITGKIAMSLAWSGDAVYSMDLAEEKGVTLAYSVPIEGSNVWFDGWCMPKGANKELAQDFINFVSRPEIAARNMDVTGYTSAIVGNDIFDLINDWYGCDDEDGVIVDLTFYFGDSVYDEIDEEGNVIKRLTDGKVLIKTSEIGRQFSTQYPDQETLDRCGVMRDFGDQNKKVLRMWMNFKSNSLEPVVIVLLILLGVIIIGVYLIFLIKKINKKRRIKAYHK